MALCAQAGEACKVIMGAQKKKQVTVEYLTLGRGNSCVIVEAVNVALCHGLLSAQGLFLLLIFLQVTHIHFLLSDCE
jgi:uncharacterized protein YdeI (YjbR/CyaY-like superfamily)